MSLQLQNSVNCPDICHAIAFPPSLSKDPFVLVIIISYEDSGLPARPSCVGYARTRSCPSTTLKAVPMLGGMSRNTAREHFLKSSPLDLGQRRLGFWEPKGHLHDPIEVDRRRQRSTGLLLLAGRGIQRAQAMMAVGHERTHAEF